MKTGLHPNYQVSEVICACGNKFVTRSILSKIKVDICSNCHPFFTGQQRLVDTAGRVERFGKRFSKTDGKAVKRKKQVQKRIAKSPLKPSGKRVLSSMPTKKKQVH